MIQRDLQGFVITPSEIQNEARSVNADMLVTDRGASSSYDAETLAGWNDFYAAWKIFYGPIDEASVYNPIGPLWWSGTMDSIRDWRSRLITWQKALQAVGGDVPVSAQQGTAGVTGLPTASDLTGILKWSVIGLVAVVGVVKVLPLVESYTAKRKSGRKA